MTIRAFGCTSFEPLRTSSMRTGSAALPPFLRLAAARDASRAVRSSAQALAGRPSNDGSPRSIPSSRTRNAGTRNTTATATTSGMPTHSPRRFSRDMADLHQQASKSRQISRQSGAEQTSDDLCGVFSHARWSLDADQIAALRVQAIFEILPTEALQEIVLVARD